LRVGLAAARCALTKGAGSAAAAATATAVAAAADADAAAADDDWFGCMQEGSGLPLLLHPTLARLFSPVRCFNDLMLQ